MPELPEGIKRFHLRPLRNTGFQLVKRPDGELIYVSDLPAIRDQVREEERERLGMVECPNCDEGTITETESERDPNGDLVPIPVPARCPDCDGTGFRQRREESLDEARFSAEEREREMHDRALAAEQKINQAAQHERERLAEWLNARESSALVQSETSDEGGTLRWVAKGRAEAYRDALDRLDALSTSQPEEGERCGGSGVIKRPASNCGNAKGDGSQLRPGDLGYVNGAGEAEFPCPDCSTSQVGEGQQLDAFLGKVTDAVMEERPVVAALDKFAFDGTGYSVATANRMREAFTAAFVAADLAALLKEFATPEPQVGEGGDKQEIDIAAEIEAGEQWESP